MRLNDIKTIACASVCALFLAVISPLAARAQTETPLEVAVYPAAAPLKVWVVLTKPATTRPTRIDLLDANNQVLAATVLPKKQDRVRQLFDMSAMSDGMYRIRVVTGKETVLKTFEVKTPTVAEPLPQRLVIPVVADKTVAGL